METVQLTKTEIELIIEALYTDIDACNGFAPNKLDSLLAKFEVLLSKMDDIDELDV